MASIETPVLDLEVLVDRNLTFHGILLTNRYGRLVRLAELFDRKQPVRRSEGHRLAFFPDDKAALLSLPHHFGDHRPQFFPDARAQPHQARAMLRRAHFGGVVIDHRAWFTTDDTDEPGFNPPFPSF